MVVAYMAEPPVLFWYLLVVITSNGLLKWNVLTVLYMCSEIKITAPEWITSSALSSGKPLVRIALARKMINWAENLYRSNVTSLEWIVALEVEWKLAHLDRNTLTTLRLKLNRIVFCSVLILIVENNVSVYCLFSSETDWKYVMNRMHINTNLWNNITMQYLING